MTKETPIKIQLPPLSVEELNILLEGLKLLPLGTAFNLFTMVMTEGKKQVEAQVSASEG